MKPRLSLLAYLLLGFYSASGWAVPETIEPAHPHGEFSPVEEEQHHEHAHGDLPPFDALSIAAATDEATREQQNWASSLWQSLNLLDGEIRLLDDQVLLNVGEDFIFLTATDAQQVMREIWQQAPEDDLLGLLIPAQYTAFDERAWGATLRYLPLGQITTTDFNTVDQTALFSQLVHKIQQQNPAEQLRSWAIAPSYQPQQHILVWGINLDSAVGTQQRYAIRLLGRYGVLALDITAQTAQAGEIQATLAELFSLMMFNPGFAYEDFQANQDALAEFAWTGLLLGENMRVPAAQPPEALSKALSPASLSLWGGLGLLLLLAISAIWWLRYQTAHEAVENKEENP